MNLDRKEKIGKLEEARTILKSEFIGLDDIIDEVVNSISSWYITPEIINRPLVISLWGMTGTGKSSVVKRLLEILQLQEISLFFDCGECTNDNKDIGSDISDAMGIDDDDQFGSFDRSRSFVFVFDEFQYARTINDEGNEEVKSSLRPIWSLLDSGLVDLGSRYSWSYVQLCSFIDDLGPFALSHPDIIVEENQIKDREQVKAYLENVGFIYSNRSVPGITSKRVDECAQGDEESDEDPYRPVTLLDNDRIKIILRRLNGIKSGSGNETIQTIVNNRWTIYEFYTFLDGIRNRISRPKVINCSNSLVFVIGNLDEAFQVADEMSPDMEADMFYEVTKKVNISDIKGALMRRFRPEQIARMGNNLIKYPTLNKDSFQKIIEKETDRICTEFKEATGIKLTVGNGMKELLYFEGVFPTQGVRPIFTTIGAILTPYLSKILLGVEKRIAKGEVTIDAIGGNTGFRSNTSDIVITYEGGETETYTHNLQLGELRNPENRKRRYICSVHEAGHGVAYAYMTGKAPESIVSVSTEDGGFCSTYDKEYDREIRTRGDIDTEVIVSMAGYMAEEVIFEDPSIRLMGSSSDINEAWETLSKAAYGSGYFNNFLYGNHRTDDGYTAGGSSSEDYKVEYYDGEDFTGETMLLEDAIHKRFVDLQEVTREIIENDKTLIIKLALELGEKGSITAEEFTEFVGKYGKTLTLDDMKQTREDNDPKYYLEELLEQ